MTAVAFPVRAEGARFVDNDGMPFIPMGTTVYALLYQREERIRETLASLYASPFNKVRFCILPKHYRYNGDITVPDPEIFPFERTGGRFDVTRPHEPFWARAAGVIRELEAHGIIADVILFHPYDEGYWGFDSLSMKDNFRYIDLCIERLGQFKNVWWSAANEYDLCRFKKLGDWKRLIARIAERDGGRHLLSCHNGLAVWNCKNSPVTHASIQSHSMWRIPDWAAAFRKPIVMDECCYEGDLREVWGSISGKELVRRFWQAYALGGYASHGETFYNDGGPVWWAMGGRLRGESIERLRFLKELLSELPGPLTYDPSMPAMATLSDPGFLKLVMKRRNPDGFLANIVCRFAPKDAEPFIRSVFAMDEGDLLDMKEGQLRYFGRVGDEAFLRYYGRQTCGSDVLELPENGAYRIELMDTWAMTRQVLFTHAAGRTTIPLPGKEDQAILAVRINFTNEVSE